MSNTITRVLGSRIGEFASLLWLPVVLIVIIFVASAGSTNIYFPPATVVFETIVDGFTSGSLSGALLYSMQNFIIGYLIAVVIGIAGGLLLGEQELLRDATQPLLNFIRSLPFVALVPIFIIALGIGPAPKVALIALGCLWPILLNTTDGVRGISASILETSRSFRIRHDLRLRRVTLMGALPQIFAGLRIALSVGIVMVVVSEMYGSPEGIGHYILFSGQRFAISETWAGTVVLAIVGYLVNLIFIGIERLSLGWYFQQSEPAKKSSKTTKKSSN